MSEIIDLGPGFKSRLAWDLLAHDEVKAWLPKLGLVPPSEEGFHMDHVKAHERLLRLEPIAPLIVALGSIASDVHATYTISEAEQLLGMEEDEDIEEDDDEEFDEEEVEALYRTIVGNIITSGAMAIISELLQDQVLTIGPGAE